MISRKEFLKSASGLLAGAVALPLGTLLEGCAASVFTTHAAVVENKVVIPLITLPDLTQPNSYAKVYVSKYGNPFILFSRDGGELWAVLSTCSHNGCEVRKLRTSFECPCHGSEYDLRGNVLRGPAPAPLESYPVRQFADRYEFQLEGQP
jgi:Rieske Fe-S protein